MNATQFTPWGQQPLEDTFAATTAVRPHSNDNAPPAPATAPPADVKASIADEAKRIVSGARRAAYGAPESNFERIARLWTAHLQNTGRNVVIVAGDVSLLMILMKVARLAETPDHRDSWVDTVGYALTGAEVNGVGRNL